MRHRILLSTSSLILAVVLVADCFGTASRILAGDTNVQFHVDLAWLGRPINNKWSSVNSWAYRDSWLSTDDKPADYFSTHYSSIQNVQIMSATGGCYVGYPDCSNVNRDLFLKPQDRTTLTDYNFAPLIQAVHGILKQGLKPWIKTGAVPIKLSARPSISQAFAVNKRPPDDYDAYYAYMKACATAMVNEFGLDEVRTWTWGVLTEFENQDWFEASDETPASTQTAYFKLYDYTVAALESVIGADHLKVGAHSAAFTQKFWDPLTFIDHVAFGTNYYTGKQGTHIDYLSFSYYEDEPGDPGDLSATKKHLSLVETVNLLRNRAIADGLTHLQYGIDEGGILIGPDGKSMGRYALGDSYQGSWDALLFKTMVDNDIAWFSRWELSSNNIWEGLPYVGTHVATLSYKMTGDQVVPSTQSGAQTDPTDIVGAVAGYNSVTNTVHLLLFNHNPGLFNGQPEPVTINLSHIAPVSGNTVKVREWLVDDQHGNFWPLWWADMEKRGIPGSHYAYSRYWVEPAIALNDPADRDYYTSRQAAYEDAAALRSTDIDVVIAGDSLNLSEVLSDHGVVFYEITNVRQSEGTVLVAIDPN